MTIILDLAKAEIDAAFTIEGHWKTEEERTAKGNAHRAKELLKELTDEEDKFGCKKIKSLNHPDAIYFLSDALESGKAAIFAPRSEVLLENIRVRYLGFRGDPLFGRGDILFYLPQEELPFFAVPWWIA